MDESKSAKTLRLFRLGNARWVGFLFKIARDGNEDAAMVIRSFVFLKIGRRAPSRNNSFYRTVDDVSRRFATHVPVFTPAATTKWTHTLTVGLLHGELNSAPVGVGCSLSLSLSLSSSFCSSFLLYPCLSLPHLPSLSFSLARARFV